MVCIDFPGSHLDSSGWWLSASEARSHFTMVPQSGCLSSSLLSLSRLALFPASTSSSQEGGEGGKSLPPGAASMKLLELMLLSDDNFKLSPHPPAQIHYRKCYLLLTIIKSSLKFPIVVVVVVILFKRLKIQKFSRLKTKHDINSRFRHSMFKFWPFPDCCCYCCCCCWRRRWPPCWLLLA